MSSEQDNQEKRFQRVSLEGHSRTYTTAVITAASLWLVVLTWDQGFLEGHNNQFFFGLVRDLPLPAQWFLWSILLLFWASVDGFIAFLSLLPNLRLDDMRDARNNWIMLVGMAGVFTMNMGTALNAAVGEQRFHMKREGAIMASRPGHYYISICLWVSVLVVDVLYIVSVHIKMQQKREQSSIQQSHSSAPTTTEGQNEKPKETKHIIAAFLVNVLGGFIDVFFVRLPGSVWMFLVSCEQWAAPRVMPIAEFLWGCMLRGRVVDKKAKTEDNGAATEAANGATSLPLPLVDTKKIAELVSRMELGTHTETAYRKFVNWVEQIWKGVKDDVDLRTRSSMLKGSQDSKTTFKFRHSAWVLSGIVTSCLLLVYFALAYVGVARSLVDRYEAYRDCVLENEALYREVLRFSGFGGGVNKNSIVRIAQGLGAAKDRVANSTETADEFYSCKRKASIGHHPVIAVLNIVNSSLGNETDPITEFRESTVGTVAVVLDNVILNFRWSACLGAILGVVFGVRTLVSVLQQYKRARQEAWENSDRARSARNLGSWIEARASIEFFPGERWRQARFFAVISASEDKWEDAYPLNTAIHFLGTLVSTVMLQNFIVFFLVSLVLAMLGSLKSIIVLLLPFIGLAAVSVGTYLIENCALQRAIIRNITSGYSIHHPSMWVCYLLIQSMVQLILGVLQAVARLIGMVIVAVMRMGRLDVNQYPILRNLDTGEVAFGATVLLHHAAHVNTVGKKQQDDADDLKELLDAQGLFKERRKVRPLRTMSASGVELATKNYEHIAVDTPFSKPPPGLDLPGMQLGGGPSGPEIVPYSSDSWLGTFGSLRQRTTYSQQLSFAEKGGRGQIK